MGFSDVSEYVDSLLKKILHVFLNYSHIALIDTLFPYLFYVSAACLGLVQAALTYHLFPEILSFIATTLNISIALQGPITWLVVAATFFTFFMLGKSVEKTNVKNKITNSLKQSSSLVKTISVLLVFIVIHLLELGLFNEFFLNLSVLPFVPAWLGLVICGFAISNLLIFSIERTVNTIDVFSDSDSSISHENILMFLSMHIILFYALGVPPIASASIIFPIIAAGIFCFAYYKKNYDHKKTPIQNADYIINNWVFLITHSAAEGGLVAAGIYSFLKNKHVAALALVASTVCEELEDLVHAHKHNEPPDLAGREGGDEITVASLYAAGYSKDSITKFGFCENDLNGCNESIKNITPQDIIQILIRAKLKLPDLIKIAECSEANIRKGITKEDIVKLGRYTEYELIEAGITEEEMAVCGYPYYVSLRDMTKFNVLSIMLLVCIGWSPFSLATVLFGNICYIANMYMQKEPASGARLSPISAMSEYIPKKTWKNIVFYGCIITSLCIGINGGLEFLHLFGTSINMVIFIAISGAIVESLVLFDQIINKGSADHHHRSANIFSTLFNTSNILCAMILALTISAPINVVLAFNLVSPLNISFIFILATLMYGRELFNTTSNILDEGASKSSQILAICALVLLNIISIPTVFIHIGLFTLNSHIALSLLPILFLMPLIIFSWDGTRARLSEPEIDNPDACCPNSSGIDKRASYLRSYSFSDQCPKHARVSFIPKEALAKMTKGERVSEKRNETPVA